MPLPCRKKQRIRIGWIESKGAVKERRKIRIRRRIRRRMDGGMEGWMERRR